MSPDSVLPMSLSNQETCGVGVRYAKERSSSKGVCNFAIFVTIQIPLIILFAIRNQRLRAEQKPKAMCSLITITAMPSDGILERNLDGEAGMPSMGREVMHPAQWIQRTCKSVRSWRVEGVRGGFSLASLYGESVFQSIGGIIKAAW